MKFTSNFSAAITQPFQFHKMLVRHRRSVGKAGQHVVGYRVPTSKICDAVLFPQ